MNLRPFSRYRYAYRYRYIQRKIFQFKARVLVGIEKSNDKSSEKGTSEYESMRYKKAPD